MADEDDIQDDPQQEDEEQDAEAGQEADDQDPVPDDKGDEAAEEEKDNEDEEKEKEDDEENTERLVVKPPPPPVDIPLSAADLHAGLGGLARVGDGLDYAYTVLSVANKGFTSMAVLTPEYGFLQHVDVNHNKLAHLETLQGLPGLLSVDASFNQVARVDFRPLPALQKANLARNQLSALAAGDLGSTLRWLDLSRNQLTGVDAINGLSLLHSLNVARNRLSALPLSLAVLTSLNVSSNPLLSLDGLAGVPALVSLIARDCGLTTLPAIKLPALQKIDLSANKLEMVEAVKLGDICQALQSVHLADNPVADAGDYRLELLVSARTLRVLDDIPFEQEELQEAAELRKSRK